MCPVRNVTYVSGRSKDLDQLHSKDVPLYWMPCTSFAFRSCSSHLGQPLPSHSVQVYSFSSLDAVHLLPADEVSFFSSAMLQ